MPRLWRHAEGTAAIELGLILPVLLVVLVGIVDYGHIYFRRLTMTNAAREGARVGVTMSEVDAQPAAIAAATAYLDNAGITATVTATSPSQTNPTVTVTVTIEPFEPLIGLVPTPDGLAVSASMRNSAMLHGRTRPSSHASNNPTTSSTRATPGATWGAAASLASAASAGAGDTKAQAVAHASGKVAASARSDSGRLHQYSVGVTSDRRTHKVL